MARVPNPLTALRHVPLFSSCSAKALARIAKACERVTFPAGRVLIEQGQPGREAFIVVKGAAVVRRSGRKIAHVGPGAMIGELALLDHGPRTATVVCETECDVLVLSQRHFHGVLDDVPALSHKLLATLAARIREFDRSSYG